MAGLLTKIAKGVGGFAEAYGPALTEMGKVRTSKELVQQEMDWTDLKASKLAEAKVSSEQVAARRKATELVLKEVGDQITTIEGSLGGQTGLQIEAGMRKIQMDRLEKLQNIQRELTRAHLVDVGWGEDYIIDVLFPGRRKKKNGDGDGNGDEEKVVAAVKKLGEGGEDGFITSLWKKGKPTGFLGDEAAKRLFDLGEVIKNIAWKDDKLLNAIKGVTALGAEDSVIRQAIATVLGREPSLSNAQSEADVRNIISDKGLLETIVGKIISFIADPLNRGEADLATDEEAARLDSPVETDPDSLRARGIVPVGDEADSPFPAVDTDQTGDESVGIIDGQIDGLITRATRADPNLEMRVGGQYGGGDYTEQPYKDYAPTVPAYDAGSLTEGTTEALPFPPAHTEGDVNQAIVRALNQGVTEGTTEALQTADISEIKGFVSEIGKFIKEGSTEALQEIISKDLRSMYKRSVSKLSVEEYLLYLMSELQAAGVADHVPLGWVFKISTAASGTLKMGRGWFEENVLSD
jgi:hypothetical protein